MTEEIKAPKWVNKFEEICKLIDEEIKREKLLELLKIKKNKNFSD